MDQLKEDKNYEKSEDNWTVCARDRARILVRGLRRKVGRKCDLDCKTGDDRADRDLPEDINLSGGIGFSEDINLSDGFDLPEDVDLSGGIGFSEDIDLSGGFDLPKDIDLSGGFDLPKDIDLSGGFHLPESIQLGV